MLMTSDDNADPKEGCVQVGCGFRVLPLCISFRLTEATLVLRHVGSVVGGLRLRL